MLFVWVILIAAAGLSVLNAALTQSFAGMLQMAAWESVVRTLCAVTYAFVLDALLAVFIRRALPSKWFDHKKALFRWAEKKRISTKKRESASGKIKFPNGENSPIFPKTKSPVRRITNIFPDISWNFDTAKRFISFPCSPALP